MQNGSKINLMQKFEIHVYVFKKFTQNVIMKTCTDFHISAPKINWLSSCIFHENFLYVS